MTYPTKNVVIALIIILFTVGVGVFVNLQNKSGNQNNNNSSNTLFRTGLSSVVSSSVENKDIQIINSSNGYKITYVRGGNISNVITEITNVLAKTNMNDDNKVSLLATLKTNEGLYIDTKSECGFNNPSSQWCMRITNLKNTQIVQVDIQKEKFVAR